MASIKFFVATAFTQAELMGGASIIETLNTLSPSELSRLIEMAWEDRTPFEAIEKTFGLPEPKVIAIMRKELKRSSFELWRKRVYGRATKHNALRNEKITRAYCPSQYKHK